MNRFLLAAIVCATFGWNGFAQTAADAPASKEDVERYFHAVHSHDMMQKMMEAMSKPMHQMVREQCIKDQDKLPSDCEARIDKMTHDIMIQIAYVQMTHAML